MIRVICAVSGCPALALALALGLSVSLDEISLTLLCFASPRNLPSLHLVLVIAARPSFTTALDTFRETDKVDTFRLQISDSFGSSQPITSFEVIGSTSVGDGAEDDAFVSTTDSIFDILRSTSVEEGGAEDDALAPERMLQIIGGIQPLPLGSFLPLNYNVSNKCWEAFSKLQDVTVNEISALPNDPCRCSDHIPYLQG
jgi:hypothetical protein